MNTQRSIAKTAYVLFLIGLAPLAWASDHPLHARVSFDAGGTLIRGVDDAEWSQAPLNTMVLQGDTLWVDQGGTAEIEFSGGTFLRMADGSRAEIAGLPPSGLVRGWYGSFQVQRMNRSSGDFVFATPACMVEVERDTAVRLDVVDQGATTVSVRWGRVIVRTDAGGAVYVNTGQRVWVDPGMLPSTPMFFDRTVEDAFDVWNRERAKLLAEGFKSAPTSVSFAPQTLGVVDLAPYGEWVYVDNRHYWRPTVVVDYVPYRYGYWSYVPVTGYVWVGRYPFSYITTHYGRWRYHVSYGWIWAYDPVWSPAWAATIRCGDYFIWAPVDFYHRPIVVRDSAVFTVGGVMFDISVSSYVYAGAFYRGPAYVYPLTPVIATYVRQRPHEVNIWNINININAPNRVRTPYTLPPDRVRNYNPPRAIRGPAALDETALTAQHRAQRLESSLGRDRFTHVASTGGRGLKTDLSPQGRMAQVRNVRMESTTADALRAAPKIRGADPQLGPGIERRTMTASEATPRGDAGRGVRSGAAPADAPTRSGASMEERPKRGSAVPSEARPIMPEPSGAPASAPTRGDAAGGGTIRTQTQPRGSATPAGPAEQENRPERGAPVTPRTEAPSLRGTPTEGRSFSPAPRTTVPPTSRDIEATPGIRGRGAAYQPTPSSRPAQTTPRPASPPAISRPSVPSMNPAPSRGAPAVSAPAPSVRQSAPAPSDPHSAPSVSAPAPSVRQSAPSVSRGTPVINAPSVGRSAPGISAPSVGRSTPGISAPSVGRSAPGISAPSVGRSAPTISAPSVGRSAPTISAPSVGRSAPSVRGGASGGAVRGR